MYGNRTLQAFACTGYLRIHLVTRNQNEAGPEQAHRIGMCESFHADV